MEKDISEELSKYLRKVGKLASRAGWGRGNRSKLLSLLALRESCWFSRSGGYIIKRRKSRIDRAAVNDT